MPTDFNVTNQFESISTVSGENDPVPVAAKSRCSLDRVGKVSLAIILVCSILIGVFLFILYRQKQAADTNPMPAFTTDPADYSLAGSIRYIYTQSGKGLYMRAMPEAGSTVVAGIPDGEDVVIRKTQDNWAYVVWDTYEGWCHMNYLLTEEAYAEVMAEFLNIPAIVITETSPLRLRETPSLDAEAIESMPKGSQVIVLRLEDEWAYVDYQGISGWCSAAYLELQE